MISAESIEQRIFHVSDNNFEKLALEVFRIQAASNPVYTSYLKHLNIEVEAINKINQIPFLPIDFFKTQEVKLANKKIEKIFLSSGTTQANRSKHFIANLSLYRENFLRCFEHFYGSIADYHILALLPSYLENKNSSLIYMIDHFIKLNNNPLNGYYKNNLKELLENIQKLKIAKKKVLLFGVSFALLDFAEKFEADFSGITIMETGGMKGQRKEITRKELHVFLKKRFNVSTIHSEYGMTELLSQAYSKSDGIFQAPSWVKVMARDINDPFSLLTDGSSGPINIIDLANIYSCSFIATNDLGKVYLDKSFEILGRVDNSDIRGCNLLIS